jgi:uncharacterized membrane protein
MNSIGGDGLLLRWRVPSIRGLVVILLAGLFSPTLSRAASADGPIFQVSFPKSVKAGAPIKVHVLFASEAPAHTFYKLQVDVDGQPVAMADLADERSSWITIEPQPTGGHTVSILWRNPPGRTPFSRSGSVMVLPAHPSTNPDSTGNGTR